MASGSLTSRPLSWPGTGLGRAGNGAHALGDLPLLARGDLETLTMLTLTAASLLRILGRGCNSVFANAIEQVKYRHSE